MAKKKAVVTTYKIGDKEYTISPIGPADYHAAAKHIRNERIADLIEQTRHVPYFENTRAQTLAEIMKSDVSWDEVLGNSYGHLLLLYRSLSKKHPEITVDELINKLDNKTFALMGEAMFNISPSL